MKVSSSFGAFGLDAQLWTCPGQLWTCPSSDFSSNFTRFGFRNEFLKLFPDDSAWFCAEKHKKHNCSIKKRDIYIHTDLDPKDIPKLIKNIFYRVL